MLIPRPAQIEGALFLQGRRAALLADEPRCGKTGAAIMALEMIGAHRALIITTASGREVWRAAFQEWASHRPAPAVVADTSGVPTGDTVIVGWPGISAPRVRHALLAREWDRIIVDESHYAAAPDSQRTIACYGRQDVATAGLCSRAAGVWCMSGTPTPNAPHELHPMLRTLFPEVLRADESKGWKDVTRYDDFVNQFCTHKIKQISFRNYVRVVTGGRNIDELRERWGGAWLRRTQEQVGIKAPAYEILPLFISDKQRRDIDAMVTPEQKRILEAADADMTQSLTMHFGPLRRLTGVMKANALAELVRDELNGGMAKVVLMSWHTDVVETLADQLAEFGARIVHGATSAAKRAENISAFQNDSRCRVISCQMQAAGEAVDLSASDELIFCESSFVPKDMQQAALRITNLAKKINTRVRVAALAKSIDEALQLVVARKMRSIRELLA